VRAQTVGIEKTLVTLRAPVAISCKRTANKSDIIKQENKKVMGSLYSITAPEWRTGRDRRGRNGDEARGWISLLPPIPGSATGPASPMLIKGKGSPHSITERRVPELIPVLGSQTAGDVSHKPGGRLPLLSARPAVTLATLMRAATSFAAW